MPMKGLTLFQTEMLRPRRTHIQGSPWDTGDAVSEPNRVMKVRAKALFNLENSISKGTQWPYLKMY
jgi:hypothetical protein